MNRSRIKTTSRHRRGFLTLEMIGGLILVGIMLGTLGTAVVRQRALSTRLANEREAVRRAELALLQLQNGLDRAAIDASVTLRLSDRPAPANFKWCEAIATTNGRTATLVGLVPEGSVR